MQLIESILILGILIYLFGIFSKKINLEALEKNGFAVILIGLFIPFIFNTIRVFTAVLEIYAVKKGTINDCHLKADLQVLINKRFSYINISCCFFFSIVLFIYENYFKNTKNLHKRNNIIISYFLMGLNQLIMVLISFSILSLKGTKHEALKNILTDLPRLRGFFLSLIIIWFEGKGKINVNIYTPKKVLTTNELHNLFSDFIWRTKNKSLKDLVVEWDRFQKMKKNKDIKESEIAIKNQEDKMLKKIELEEFYLFHFSDEFLSYTRRIQKAGKNEMDIN